MSTPPSSSTPPIQSKGRPGVFAIHTLLSSLARGVVLSLPVGDFAKGSHLFGTAAAMDLDGASVRLTAWDVSAGSRDALPNGKLDREREADRPVLRIAVHQGLVYAVIPRFPVRTTDQNRLTLPDIAKAVPNPDAKLIQGYCATYSPLDPLNTSKLWIYGGERKERQESGDFGVTYYWVESEAMHLPILAALRSGFTGRTWGYLK